MWSVLFPGQGSQAPGMGKFLWDEFTQAKRAFEEASDTLGVDFKKLCFEGSEADLALTENTQPCLVLVSIAAFRVIQDELGFKPKAAAGHSVGEYAAVVAAGALPFSSAIKAVRLRGQAMQSAVPVGQGGMTAVMGMETEQILALCKWAEQTTGDGPVQPANINAPGQIVISGKKSVLDYIGANFKSEMIPGVTRAKFIPLKVSAPFHCSMMKPAEDTMRGVLGEMKFTDGAFPVVQNVNAKPVINADELRKHLVTQVSAPVRWIECVRELATMGAGRAVECGSGKVLSGLVKKIEPEKMRVFALTSMEDFKALETELKGS